TKDSECSRQQHTWSMPKRCAGTWLDSNLLLRPSKTVSRSLWPIRVRSTADIGTMFNVADYPGMVKDGERLILANPAELRAKFSFETTVTPLPVASDFRV